ncbi:MAG: hypothetical protein ACRBB4_16715 [Neptuniibacter sp.]
MDIALCMLDGKRYDVSSFSKLKPIQLDRLRRSLVCKECRGKGYYRKESRDGKPACFGAYHKDNCRYKSQGSAPLIDPITSEEVNKIITNNDTIDVDFTIDNTTKLNRTSHDSTTVNRTYSVNTSQQHTKQPSQKRHCKKGLGSLLRMLMHSDSFAGSDIKINTGWEYSYKAKNLFVNFNDINKELINNKKMRGYWGVISHADDELSWLNTANQQDVSIPISEFKDNLINTFKINHAEDLAGSAVLVFGWLDISKSDKQKWYIKANKSCPASIFINLKR